MSGNIPGSGGSVLPGVFTEVVTQSRGASIPGGIRIAAIIGEGAKSEVVVASAQGGGDDGFNDTYTSTNGQDGRHFRLSEFPVIENRATLYRNGIPLVGLETETWTTTFSNLYDYRLDVTTGEIELQSAYIVNQGGDDIVASASNVGDGYIISTSLDLLDLNAPTETWIIKCVSAQRNPSNVPIANTAKFAAFGSVSGQKLDSNGNPVLWAANESTTDNGILEFAVSDGATPFTEGDSFTVKVKSGVLNRNDSLTASYIPTINLNEPVFLESMDTITKKHGSVSLDNTLSLGCQLAFANGTPGIMCVQAAPAMPRRTSYVLSDGVAANSVNNEDFTFPLPVGVFPNINSSMHFFVKNNATSVETQVLPNKFDFYTTIDGTPTLSQFTQDDTLAPSGYSYGYTVITDPVVTISGFDGYMTNDGYVLDGYTGIFSSDSVVFDQTSFSGTITLKVLDAVNSVNNGEFTITAVSGGVLYVKGVTPILTTLVNEGDLRFEIVDTALDEATQAHVVINHNVVPNGYSLRVNIVDERDAAFYDAGWINALESLETQECDIIVPLPKQTISAIFQNVLNHCKTMSNIKNKKERVLFCGAINGLIPANLTGAADAAVDDIGILEGIQGDSATEILAGTVEDLANYSVADAFGTTYRCVYFFPDQIVVQAGADNVLIDGFYLAAAAAGYCSGVGNVAIPLTNKVLAGFTILRNKQFSPLVMEQLVAAGVTVVQPVAGGGRVVWGLTTTQSGFAEEQEISIVFIRDRIAKSLRGAFQGFIGIAEDDTTIPTLSARAISALNAFLSQGLITAFRDVNVTRDAVDPRQWNVSVRVQPTYPVNFIYIRVGLGVL